MVGPSIEQKTILAQQLAGMDPASWIAMVKWNLEKFTEDQPYLVSLIVAEAERRMDRESAISTTKRPIKMHLWDVLKDLGLKIVVAG